MLFSNKNYLILLLCIGGLFGFVNGLTSTMSQISCSVGYTSEFTGVAVSLLLFFGVIGGTAATFVYGKTGYVEEQAKITFGFIGLFVVIVLYLLLQPDQEVALAILLSM